MIFTIQNIPSSCIIDTGGWVQIFNPLLGKRKSNVKGKDKKDNPFYSFGIFKCQSGLVDLQFMKYTPFVGDLKVTVNIPKIFNGNSTTPKSDISLQDLERIIHKEISGVCDISKLKPIADWCITKDESNLDFIGDGEDLDALFQVILKTKIPRYKLDSGRAVDGTIYFYTGVNRETSNSVICVYFKDKELKDKNDIYINDGRLLAAHEKCLRIEIRC